MDWPAFIVGMTDALAWPGALLLLMLVFRKELRPLILSLRKLTWRDTVFEFDKRLEVAEDRAKQLLPPEPTLALPKPDEAEERFETTLEISPELAVVEAWLPIERELHSLAAKHGYITGRARSVTFVIRRLTQDGIIDSATENLISELRNLRNLALHRQDGLKLSNEDVRRYSELAQAVTRALRRAGEL